MYGQERWKKNRLLFWRKNGEGCFKKERNGERSKGKGEKVKNKQRDSVYL